MYECILDMGLVPTEISKSIRAPQTELTENYESPFGCCKLNLDPVEKQAVLLASEPTLHPLEFYSLMFTFRSLIS